MRPQRRAFSPLLLLLLPLLVLVEEEEVVVALATVTGCHDYNTSTETGDTLKAIVRRSS